MECSEAGFPRPLVLNVGLDGAPHHGIWKYCPSTSKAYAQVLHDLMVRHAYICSLMQDSPLAKSVSLGGLNQKLGEAANNSNAGFMTQTTGNLARASSARLPHAQRPPLGRRPSLTQISNQLAGMTSLTISNGVVIKPEY